MSERTEMLTEALRTARTKSERAKAIAAFTAQPVASEARSAEESRFTNWLAAQGQGWIGRAASEGIATAGGDLVPTAFNSNLIRAMREYDGLFRDFEQWDSPDGEAVVRPTGSSFVAATAASENVAFTEGPAFSFGSQPWGLCPTFAASGRLSNQMVQDAFRVPSQGSSGGTPSLDALVFSLLGESLGRVVAPVASAALYATISAVGAASGQAGGYVQAAAGTPVSFITGSASTELIQNTISIDTAALMFAALDVAYLDGAKWYFSSQQWTNLIRQVDAQKHLQINPALGRKLFDFPVVLTSQTATAAASTVSGPVFGNLEAAMTLRLAGGADGLYLFRSAERYAEYLQAYYRAMLRADVAARDVRGVIGVQYNTT